MLIFHCNYGDVGVDDPALDLKRPEILRISKAEVISGYSRGEFDDQLFIKQGTKIKYVVEISNGIDRQIFNS